jgi:hypothetical protein
MNIVAPLLEQGPMRARLFAQFPLAGPVVLEGIRQECSIRGSGSAGNNLNPC